ncbi:SAM-dependent methyltransferase [Bradyrhizobium sp. LB12.1]|uniref:class I SAM-dependent methyltransferase n=1 Tax=Bradyrhizobium sp. LB12.1 TaxID=3156327 RepID=UPI003393998A
MAEPRLRLCPDAVLRHAEGGWIATNPRTHTHVGLSPAAAAVVGMLAGGASTDHWRDDLAEVTGVDRTGFDFRYGLWSDPSCLADPAAVQQGMPLLDLLHRRWILCADDQRDYRDYLAPLTSILDRSHLGTFHQLVGQHLALNLRLRDTWRWWHDSKFTSDGLALKAGPYKWVQAPFFDAYFAGQSVAGERLLDFACGNGFYSRKFAAMGAVVLGIDTEAELIRLAETNAAGTCQFLRPADPQASLAALLDLEPGKFDRIYMSDILLLLLEPGGDAEPAHAVISALARLLRPGGKLHLFEPNAVFWLGCRLGDAQDPMLVVSEYREQLYTVAPTLDRVMEVVGRCGLVLTEYAHPPGDHIPEDQTALRAFAHRYPLWDFLTFERRS